MHRGGKLLLRGHLGNKEVGMSWQLLLHLLLHAGSGIEGRCRHAQEEMGNELTSLPYQMLCVYRMFGFLSIPSRDSWDRRF